MLEQLKEQQNTPDAIFRDNLLRMLCLMRATQLMITYFQESPDIKTDSGDKKIKKFSKEIYSKIEWFISIIFKMAGENAHILQKELNLESSKIEALMDAAGFITMAQSDVTNAVDMMVNRGRRKELIKDAWISSRTALSPKLQLDLSDFDLWYNENFPC